MIVVDVPQTLPAQCKSCGTGDPERGPYVDTQTSEEFYGAVYYCRECALSIGRLLGSIGPEDAALLKAENEDLKSKVAEQTIKIDGLEKAVDGLRSAGYSSGVSPMPNPFGTPIQVSDQGSSGTESELGIGEGETFEPLHDEGMAELHSDESSSVTGFKLDLK